MSAGLRYKSGSLKISQNLSAYIKFKKKTQVHGRRFNQIGSADVLCNIIEINAVPIPFSFRTWFIISAADTEEGGVHVSRLTETLLKQGDTESGFNEDIVKDSHAADRLQI